MLQFTKETDYGIQLISALAKLKDGELLSLRSFANDSKISFLFLQRIAKKLRMANLITSSKGAQGGYKLAKDFKKITVKEVVESLEGECAVANCLKKNCVCERSVVCCSRKVFKTVNEKINRFLDELRLKDILEKDK